jgi:transcriptional regulator with XRE-family HTH domain
MDRNEHFIVIENKKTGRNLALYRKMRDKKALEVAEYLGMSEAAYTKYERGESKITVEIVQKVSEFLKVNPISVLTSQPESFIESFNTPVVTNSSVLNPFDECFQDIDAKQNKMIIKLMENVVKLSERTIEMIEEREEKK